MIRLEEGSDLSVRRTLRELGVSRSVQEQRLASDSRYLRGSSGTVAPPPPPPQADKNAKTHTKGSQRRESTASSIRDPCTS